MTDSSVQGVVAIDVGGTKIGGAILDENFNFIYERTVASRENIVGIADPELNITKSLILEMRDYAERNGIALKRGCAGFPEYVNLEGLLTTAENIDWRQQPREDFAKLTGFPWVIQSDVRCAGVAEARFGAGKEIEDFVYLTISSGISHTHFLGGEAVPGPNGEAIGFGLIEVVIEGVTYELEKYCSGLGISRRYAHETQDFNLDARGLTERFDTDLRAKEVITSATKILGREMARLLMSLGTSRVVIGGGLWLGSEKYRELTELEFERSCRSLGIFADIRNACVDSSGVLGAAIYASADLR